MHELRLTKSTRKQQLIHRFSWVQHLSSDLAAADWERAIKKSDLDQQRCLIPVKVLVRNLLTGELNDGNERNFR